SICVINIYKLINGKSVFGVGNEGIKIDIISIIVDDAHACLSNTEEQFTLKIDASKTEYDELLGLFSESLKQQSETGFLEIKSQDPKRNMLVPFWSWIDNQEDVVRILYDIKEDSQIQFVLPLIKENLALCRCVFGGGKIEISPRCLPINSIPSFAKATRRIYMTATLSDDSILVTNFNATPDSLKRPITPKNANDIGDRMILIPQEINTDITNEEIKTFIKESAKQYNVIVIVPSAYKANFWSDIAAATLTSDNLYQGISDLKKGHVGVVVLINKYDGIDLPDDACRILVIDGIPDVRRKIDKIEQVMLEDSEFMVIKEIQRIEQGMGRGVRATNDHCVVFLMGNTLVKRLYSPSAQSRFSAATKAQLDLSQKVAEQLQGKPINEFEKIISYPLNKNSDWLKISRGALADIKYDEEGYIDNIALLQREAFDAAQVSNYEKSIQLIQEAVNSISDNKMIGFLKQQLAEYYHFLNPVNAQEILKSALKYNPRVLRPMEGIKYTKLAIRSMNQANQCSDSISKFSSNPNELIVNINAIIENLKFKPDTSRSFEKSLHDIAELIGFRGQRPDLEIGKGPDNFWAVGRNMSFIISCKNGATSDKICKRYCDQLSGHMNWFRERYSGEDKGIPIIIHPSHKIDEIASPCDQMRVIDTNTLKPLRESLLAFFKSIVTEGAFGKVDHIQKLLLKLYLTPNDFINKFTVDYIK
ncbi:DEAD/DEAH box helicase, partial [candidate division WOR-3 bacterium]|nr:DEAD/DEAH box helicase [candidate division WOR-3 bacterium]